LVLPGDLTIQGTIIAALPSVDAVSQTQRYRIHVANSKSIPENLIVKALYVQKAVTHAISLPKEAILTNEVQSEFWIMKMVGKNLAVKIPIVKGLESGNRVEIRSPKLLPSDQILLTGNYGLPDTANVVVENTIQ